MQTVTKSACLKRLNRIEGDGTAAPAVLGELRRG